MYNVKNYYESFAEDEIVPEARSFESHSEDKIEKILVQKSSSWLLKFMKRFAILQTGHVQHYIIYPVVFVAVVVLLTFLKII